MLFTSFDFLLFFAVAFAGFWALLDRPILRGLWLLAASYFFYMAGPKPADGPLPTPWYFVGLLVASTVVDYVCALGIAAAQKRSQAKAAQPWPPASRASGGAPTRSGRAWFFLSLVANLGLLGYFKYSGFLLQVIDDATTLVGVHVGLPTLRLLLPIGISFYTFESLSYTIDVYRGRIPAERSLLKYAVFIAIFPKLVAGPILRAGELLPQLRLRPSLTAADVDFALYRIGKGLFKKLLLADFVAASLTDRVFASPAEHSSLENLVALYAFTLQIYADFSGYSDLAIGTARLLGLRLPENFNRPYQAVDIADFWRRWHMTLSAWLRDYVYYPLGGSRVGPTRTYINLWITMFLVGIWHGASWNFVIYATVQASAMVFNRACREKLDSVASYLRRWGLVSASVTVLATLLGWAVLRLEHPLWFGLGAGALSLLLAILPSAERWPWLTPLHVLLTLHYSVLSRVFFRAESLESARAMVQRLVAWDGLAVRPGWFNNPTLAHWIESTPLLAWARPLADWTVLIVLTGGFLLHYLPARLFARTAEWCLPRVPGVVVGMSLAALFGVLSLLLAGPRANIYFAF